MTRLGAMLACAGAFCWTLTAGCERNAPSGSSGATSAHSSQPTSEEAAANLRALVAQSAADQPNALPPGHPRLDGGAGGMHPASAATTQPHGLVYAAPPAWVRETPRSNVRADQYRWPRAAGDAEDGDLAVFASGIGGSVDDNVARWRAQFSTAEGQPIPDEAFVRQTLEANGLKITLVDVAGRYSAGMAMPGGPEPAAKDGYRLLGAIVETPAGPWFFKAVGPAATVGAHREEFVEFLKSMRPE